LPTEIQWLNPPCSSVPVPSMEPPTAPDCVKNAMSPLLKCSMAQTMEVQQTMSFTIEIMPLVLGPQNRTPPALAAAINSASSSGSPASAKPDASTMAVFTPLAPQSFMTATLALAGTAIRVRSISSGMSFTLA